MGAAGILSTIGNMANEQRLHDRGRGELLSDQDRQMRAKQITDALEAGRTYGTLTPEQQSQAMDELHGLYNQPQHMPLLVDALKRVTGAVKGAYQGAIHPNAPAQNPSANGSSAAVPSAIARPAFGGSPMLPKQDASIPVTPQNPQMGMDSASPVPPMQAAPVVSTTPSAPSAPPRAPQSVGEIIASAYPRGGTFNAQMQKMITQYQLMNQGKLGVAQINAFGKKLPISGDALPANAIGPDGQPIPAEMRTGPYIRQGYFEDPNTGEPIPTYVRQVTKLGTTEANGQRMVFNPYTGKTEGSLGLVQVPTISTRQELGEVDGNTVPYTLSSSRTPVIPQNTQRPSAPISTQAPSPQAQPKASIGGTLHPTSQPARGAVRSNGIPSNLFPRGTTQRSYQFTSGQVEKLGQPVDQLTARMSRLEDALNQGTPQADALIAPELMTVMAGGQGSGIRINEAEIARTLGGRSKWESLKADLNKWSLDPSKANSITPAQRSQIRSLVQLVNGKLQEKQQAINTARQSLASSNDPKAHRQILVDLHDNLNRIDGANVGTALQQGSKPKSTGNVIVVTAEDMK